MKIKAILFDLGGTLIEEANPLGDLPNGKIKKAPFIKFILKKLSCKYKICLVTNTAVSTKIEVKLFLKKLGLANYFDIVITSVDVGVRKPNPEIFEKVLEYLSIQPSEAVVVGNRIDRDIMAAKLLGIKSVLYRHRGSGKTGQLHKW